MKKVAAILGSAVILFFAGCGEGTVGTADKDTLQLAPPDSMPVVTPGHTDSDAVIITPPVNDDIVIVPDTTGNR